MNCFVDIYCYEVSNVEGLNKCSSHNLILLLEFYIAFHEYKKFVTKIIYDESDEQNYKLFPYYAI